MDNIPKHLTNFGHETGKLRKEIISNISELLDVILEQSYPPDVTYNSTL